MAIMPDIRHLEISYNTPCLPPKTLHNLCFSFLLGIAVVPTEINNNVYAKCFFLGGGGERGGGKQGALLNDNLRSGPILAVLIHSLLSAPALFSFRPARRSVIFKAKRKQSLIWQEHSKMPPNHFGGLVCARLLANVNHSSVFV